MYKKIITLLIVFATASTVNADCDIKNFRTAPVFKFRYSQVNPITISVCPNIPFIVQMEERETDELDGEWYLTHKDNTFMPFPADFEAPRTNQTRRHQYFLGILSDTIPMTITLQYTECPSSGQDMSFRSKNPERSMPQCKMHTFNLTVQAKR